MKKLKKKALAVVLAVTTVLGSSTPVFAATVTIVILLISANAT